MDPPRKPATRVTTTPGGVIVLIDGDGVRSPITLLALKDMLHREETRTQARRVELPTKTYNGRTE